VSSRAVILLRSFLEGIVPDAIHPHAARRDFFEKLIQAATLSLYCVSMTARANPPFRIGPPFLKLPTIGAM